MSGDFVTGGASGKNSRAELDDLIKKNPSLSDHEKDGIEQFHAKATPQGWQKYKDGLPSAIRQKPNLNPAHIGPERLAHHMDAEKFFNEHPTLDQAQKRAILKLRGSISAQDWAAYDPKELMDFVGAETKSPAKAAEKLATKPTLPDIFQGLDSKYPDKAKEAAARFHSVATATGVWDKYKDKVFSVAKAQQHSTPDELMQSMDTKEFFEKNPKLNREQRRTVRYVRAELSPEEWGDLHGSISDIFKSHPDVTPDRMLQHLGKRPTVAPTPEEEGEAELTDLAPLFSDVEFTKDEIKEEKPLDKETADILSRHTGHEKRAVERFHASVSAEEWDKYRGDLSAAVKNMPNAEPDELMSHIDVDKFLKDGPSLSVKQQQNVHSFRQSISSADWNKYHGEIRDVLKDRPYISATSLKAHFEDPDRWVFL